jgi:hypothetical protein
MVWIPHEARDPDKKGGNYEMKGKDVDGKELLTAYCKANIKYEIIRTCQIAHALAQDPCYTIWREEKLKKHLGKVFDEKIIENGGIAAGPPSKEHIKNCQICLKYLEERAQDSLAYISIPTKVVLDFVRE